jgi:pimeloyl-ACP methyl ester carboxylesterase
MIYAGVRPERIRRLVNLEGFGLAATRPSQAPGRYVQWMDELKSLHRGDSALKPYADVAGVAQRLMKTNPRLPQDKADWLAGRWASPDPAGQWRIQGHAGHKVTSAHIYRLDEMLEVYKRITAPLLSVQADSLAQDRRSGVPAGSAAPSALPSTRSKRRSLVNQQAIERHEHPTQAALSPLRCAPSAARCRSGPAPEMRPWFF